jgi:dTDP-4-dehydrorhamnose 3,5-epimerase
VSAPSVVVEPTPLEGLLVVRPRVFRDDRGAFHETWNQARYSEAGLGVTFVQDNVSVSHRGVLRGLHAQRAPYEQGKLVTVLRGRAFDVAVDIRTGSPTYGRWYGLELDGAAGTQLYIPPGFLHGFLALEDDTVFAYKCTTAYRPEAEFSVRWDDPALSITWPLTDMVMSARDASAAPFHELRHRG